MTTDNWLSGDSRTPVAWSASTKVWLARLGLISLVAVSFCLVARSAYRLHQQESIIGIDRRALAELDRKHAEIRRWSDAASAARDLLTAAGFECLTTKQGRDVAVDLSNWNGTLPDARLAMLESVNREATGVGSQYFGVKLNGRRFGDEWLARIGRLTNLGSLDLALSNVTDEGLQQIEPLKQLRHLNLESTNIGDAGLRHVQGLKCLEVVILHRTKVTEAGLAELKQHRPDLKVECNVSLKTAD